LALTAPLAGAEPSAAPVEEVIVNNSIGPTDADRCLAFAFALSFAFAFSFALFVMSDVRLEVETLGVLVVSGSALFDAVEVTPVVGSSCAAAIKIESGNVEFTSSALLNLPCAAVRIVASAVPTRVTLGQLNEELTFSDNRIDVALDGNSNAVVNATHVGSTSENDRCSSLCLCGGGAASITTDGGSCSSLCTTACN
jgi:hypothetical protein